ncbi:MAG: DUF1697 domain-containing protein [Flavobacteriaceae bacterium]|nr:DUF1697 domain-containing protein [Flavobacteriaceae bacterium]
MSTYISLLRGINVSGQKLIKMDDLRKCFENLGFQDVRTHVQTGNVVFESEETDIVKIEENITRRIEHEFGFIVPVIAMTPEKLKHIIEYNPFLKDTEKDQNYFHITFLSSIPENYDPRLFTDKKLAGEEIVFNGNAAYLYCPNGYGRTKLTNNFLETKLKVGATTRNWKTTNILLKMAEKTI